MMVSNNYQWFTDCMAGISVTDVVRLVRFVERMEKSLHTDTIEGVHCKQDYETETEQLYRLVSQLESEDKKVCPRCGGLLYVSDLPQYDYVCPDCDENFYEGEVK